MSYLSPVSERKGVAINSFGRWEQAFRVFANIITTKFPAKSPKLLQYLHTIHSAFTAYQWDNVYAYDREFRRHIAKHPYRSWSVILQQAWTMILKDRIHNDYGGSRNNKQNKSDHEPCRRFNKGRCSFGLACRYDHRCSVEKCGKYGHGAHQCRLREGNHQT